jgi:hypothetical protein
VLQTDFSQFYFFGLTTHVLFSPLDFLGKLAALIPRPRHNLVRYHGVFAPNPRVRKLIVTTKRKKAKRENNQNRHKPAAESRIQDELIAPLTWAQRLKRAFNIDITLCPVCGGTLRVIADITDPDIIQKILDHIQAQPPPLEPASIDL